MVLLLVSLLLSAFPQATAAPDSAKIWEGREAQFEEFLRTATVLKIEAIPIGVTKPQRAYVEPGGLCESFAWKVLPPGIHKGFWDSYKSEVAAYELDKVLGLGMVPVTVERRIKSDTGAAVLWLKGVRSWEEALRAPKAASWNRNVVRMKMWDNLVGNSDRNKGNILVDHAGNFFFIDHSRAFTTEKKLYQKLENIDMELWNRMLALDVDTVKAAIGKWVGKGEIKAVLQRRDKMKKEIDAILAARGDAAVLK
jgi:Phosphatidylinositol 3- and 4-kinase